MSYSKGLIQKPVTVIIYFHTFLEKTDTGQQNIIGRQVTSKLIDFSCTTKSHKIIFIKRELTILSGLQIDLLCMLLLNYLQKTIFFTFLNAYTFTTEIQKEADVSWLLFYGMNIFQGH